MNATSTHIETITPDAARQRMTSGAGALLVCAYDSDQKFQEHRLAGAIPFSQFQSRVTTLPKDKEIIFYCACPHDESSLSKAGRTLGREPATRSRPPQRPLGGTECKERSEAASEPGSDCHRPLAEVV